MRHLLLKELKFHLSILYNHNFKSTVVQFDMKTVHLKIQAPISQTSRSNKILPKIAKVKQEITSITLGILICNSNILITPVANAVDLSFASPEVRQKLIERDESMDFKCKGGMFDCDGDRREYAKNQYKNFVNRMETSTDEQPQKTQPTEEDDR